MNRVFLGLLTFFVGLVTVPLALFLYLDFGRPPVAIADAPFPSEKRIVSKFLNARIASEVQSSPVPTTASTLLVGAAVYTRECSFCHGLPGRDSTLAANMYPPVPQLWRSHRAGVVGVSDDPAGETYWKVKNGIRLSGMPSYKALLSEEQMWDVSLLLASAAKPLPAEVRAALTDSTATAAKEKQ